jgi:molybdopterin/thiamine biosynthesis adenylyltransferase/rhodanese-related sulfurtransferase
VSGVRSVGTAEALRLAGEGRRIVDVREPDEWDAGHIATAMHIPLDEIATRIVVEIPDRATPILLHCHSGARSGRAAQVLVQLGYTDVANLAALIDEWRMSGGAWEAPRRLLSDGELARYQRQTLIPEIGEAGQRRLLDSRVLLVGAGGLGSPAAIYLAAGGIGTIGLVDGDDVDVSNLHRQVLHGPDRVGSPKTASARLTLNALSPATRVVEHAEWLTAGNAARLNEGYDLVVDGSDSFETRYVLNDAAVPAGIPVIHGSVYRWEGQVTSLVPEVGPCYRCLHPAPPPADLAPACSVAGVVGVLPGIIGLLQANEAIKLLLGVGEPLIGRVVTFDALATRFDEHRVARDPACSACGDAAPHAAAAARATVTT